VLGERVALAGSKPVPLQRLAKVLRHAPTLVIRHPEVELSAGVALLGQRANDPQRGRVVAFAQRGDGILKRLRGHGCGNAPGQHRNTD
jgi:hypothetical protein